MTQSGSPLWGLRAHRGVAAGRGDERIQAGEIGSAQAAAASSPPFDDRRHALGDSLGWSGRNRLGGTPLRHRKAAAPVARRDGACNQRQPSAVGGLRPSVKISRHVSVKGQALHLDSHGNPVPTKHIVGVCDEPAEVDQHRLWRLDDPSNRWVHRDRPRFEHLCESTARIHRMDALYVRTLVPGPVLVCTVIHDGSIRTATVRERLVEGRVYGRWEIGNREIRLRCRDRAMVAESKCLRTGQVLSVEPNPDPWRFEPAGR